VAVVTMGETTAIAWTDHTFNPWWGCERVSPGCQHCYAETFAKRTGHDVWGKAVDRRFFGDKHWNEPAKWNAAAEAAGRSALVFCSSMEDRPELIEHRQRLFELIEATPHLIWQLLTKRVQHVRHMLPTEWVNFDADIPMWSGPPNVWIGTTVEDQERASRLWWLIDIPAPVRFVSCEPLLGPVDLTHIAIPDMGDGYEWHSVPYLNALTGHVKGPDDVLPYHVDWVIVGGESGTRHRPLDLDHARTIRDHCSGKVVDIFGVNDRLPVPCFFKQVGGRTPTAGGDVLDGERIKEFPAFLKRSSRTTVLAASATCTDQVHP
jgi:protein gp37